MAHGLFEAFWVARVVPGDGHAAGGGLQRGGLFCRFEPPGARGVALPAPDNLLPFCWPLGVEAVKPSPYLVTCEFSFTLTGGDGQRLHGFCRKTHDPTHRPPASPGRGGGAALEHKRLPQVLCILSQHCWPAFFSKVLEVVDQLLAPHAGATVLPPDAPAALFMAALPRLVAAAGPAQPPLGAVLRAPLPLSGNPISVDRMRRALTGPGHRDLLLGLSPDAIELEVPPSLGNSTANAGVSLARLLWFLTPRQAVSLVASLLLERRIILVARDAETVSAAVHAANALLYPFRWHHIFLPLLPLALKDYLAAPMPYLAGVQADCLPLLQGLPLEEVVMIDLDRLGSCTPELGSPGDDYWQLPYARELEDVFEVVREHIKSPTEFDSTPKCTELLQDFFLRLMGRYRQFVRPDEEVTPAALALGLDRPASGRSSTASSRGVSAEENPRAHGFVFDQAAFIAAHRRKDKVLAFLQQFRNSQMLEVFITERLKLASEGYVTEDPFELQVTERNTRVSMLGLGGGSGVAAQKGRFSGLLRKAGSAVKQGGGSLVASIQRLGTSQQEELHVAGRAHSGPNLSRLSPGPGGLARSSPGPSGLPRPSPGIAAAAVLAHNRSDSFSSSRPGSRSSSYTNLHRASANLAAFNGGVEPSLEQLRADMFFGADDEDASSVASEATSAEQVAPRHGARGSAGPLERAMGCSRSFGSIFHPPVPTPGSLPLSQRQHDPSGLGVADAFAQQQWEASALAATAGACAAAAAAALSCSPSSFSGVLAPQVPFAFGTPDKDFALSSVPATAAAPMVANAAAPALAPVANAAAPASLLDFPSPWLEAGRWSQRQPPPLAQPQGRPQQLFCDVPTAAQGGGGGAWATFGDALEACPTNPFLRQESSRSATSVLDAPGRGPLGLAVPGPPAGDEAAAWQRPQQAAQPPQLHYVIPPPLEKPAPTPAPAHMPSYAQHQKAQRQLQKLAVQQRQQAAKPAPLVGLESASFGHGPLASQSPAAGVQQAAGGPLPPACRHTAHSPLAHGIPTVQRLASVNSEGSSASTPRRSSSGGGSVPGGGVALHVQHDAFAAVAAAAAADASQRMRLHRHTSSGGQSGNPFKGGLAPLSRQASAAGPRPRPSTSSFGEWSAAWPAAGDGPLGSGMPPPAHAMQPPRVELPACSLSPR